MDFQSIKNKYLIETDSKVFVGNAEEIKSLILTVEDQAETIEMYKRELLQSKEQIKILENSLDAALSKKPPYMDLDD